MKEIERRFFSIRGPFLGLRYRIWRVYQWFGGIYYRWRWRRFFKRMGKSVLRASRAFEEAATAIEEFRKAWVASGTGNLDKAS